MLRHSFFIVVMVGILNGQEYQLDEKAFFSSIQTSYYSLENTQLENFTCLITNSTIDDFARKKWSNSEIFPLQFIWIKPDRIFLSQQGVPNLEPAAQDTFQNSVNDLKQQVKAILLDLQRFYLTGLYASISEDYILVKKKQVIEILFDAVTDSLQTQFIYTFGMNGLCLKIETVYPAQNRRIVTYPNFKIVKTKWLCTGWEVQIIQGDHVISGFAVRLENRMQNDIWVPLEVRLEVQKAEEAGKTYVDVLKLKNYLFNQSLQLIEQPNSDH